MSGGRGFFRRLCKQVTLKLLVYSGFAPFLHVVRPSARVLAQIIRHAAIAATYLAEPLYADVTWGAGGSTSDLTLDMCIKLKTDYGFEPNMHLTW